MVLVAGLGAVTATIGANMNPFLADVAAGAKAAEKVLGAVGSSLKWPALFTGGAAASSIGLVTAGGAAAAGTFAALTSAAVGAATAIVSVGAAGALMSKQVQYDFANVGKTIKDDFASIGSAFVVPMERVAGSIEVVVNKLTKEFKPAISALAPLFQEFASVGLGEILALADAFKPLINAAGPILQSVLKGIQPLFAGINQTVAILAPVMAELGTKIFPLLANAIAPLLPILATMLAALAQAGEGVLPALLNIVVQIISGLAPFITQLGQLAADFLPGLLQALQPIIPFILQLADSLLSIAQQVLPVLIPILGELIAQLDSNLEQLLPQLVTAIVALADAFLQIFPALVPLLPPLEQVLSALLPIIPVVANLAAQIIKFLAPAIQLIADVIGAVVTPIAKGLTSVINTVAGWANDILGIFDKVVSGIQTALHYISFGLYTASNASSSTTSGNIFSMAAGNPKGDTNYLGQPLGTPQLDIPNAPVSAKISVGALGAALKAAAPANSAAGQAASAAAKTLSADLKTALSGVSTDTAAQIKSTWGKVITDLTSTGHKALATAVGRVSASLQSLAKSRDVVTANLSKATDNLKQLTTAASDLNKNIRDTVVALGDITGSQGWVTFESITDHLHLAIDTTNQFTAAMQKLVAEGLNQDTLSQLAAAGPAQGLATANALLAGGQAGVTQVNDLAKQLHTAAGTLADGTSNAMYAAGISAAQGLVAGLKSQQAAIEKQMSAIADAMVKEIKTKLKIKSPSQVMANEVGAQVTAGIAQGVMGNAGSLTGAAQSAADSLTAGVQGGGGMGGVQVFIGETELTNLIMKSVRQNNRATKSMALAGSRVGNIVGA